MANIKRDDGPRPIGDEGRRFRLPKNLEEFKQQQEERRRIAREQAFNNLNAQADRIRNQAIRIEMNADIAIPNDINPINADFAEVERRIENLEQGIVFPERAKILKNNMPGGGIIDTVGLEFESLGRTQHDLIAVLASLPGGLGNYFKVHRDGSAEMKVYNIPVGNRRNKSVVVNYHTKAAEALFGKTYRASLSGYEIVSVPMEINTAEQLLWNLLPKLKAEGDFMSKRCAFHVHVGMGKNLSMTKNLLRLGLWADDLFFSISGMGDKFRGSTNNAIYARPISNGPYFAFRDYYYQALNWKQALEAEDFSEFFACYGIQYGRDPIKYHPARYFSINLYSILLHGTVEFRHFNTTFNPGLAVAVTKLCQLFTEIAVKSRPAYLKGLDVADVFRTRSSSYYMDKLDTLITMGSSIGCDYQLNRQDIYELHKVIETYDGIGISDIPVMTHIKETDVTSELISEGKLARVSKKPIPPGNTDIHNIQYQSIFNDGDK